MPGVHPDAVGRPAKLVLGRQFIDLGRLGPQTTKTLAVKLRNAGGQELLIKKLEAGCRCFQPSVDRKTVPPGQSASLTVKVLTLKHRGPMNEKIGVISNDPGGVEVLAIRFEVPHDLEADPSCLYLGILRPEQEIKRQVKVVATADVNTKVLYAVSSADWLVGRVIEPSVSREKPAVLEVAMKAPAQPGTYRHDLSIATGLDSRPSVRLPVVVSVAEGASTSPEHVDFGRFIRGQTVSQEIRLALPKAARLKAATAHPKVLDVQVGPANAQGARTITLTAGKDTPYGPFRGELRLELEGKGKSALVLPLTGYVADETDG